MEAREGTDAAPRRAARRRDEKKQDSQAEGEDSVLLSLCSFVGPSSFLRFLPSFLPARSPTRTPRLLPPFLAPFSLSEIVCMRCTSHSSRCALSKPTDLQLDPSQLAANSLTSCLHVCRPASQPVRLPSLSSLLAALLTLLPPPLLGKPSTERAGGRGKEASKLLASQPACRRPTEESLRL